MDTSKLNYYELRHLEWYFLTIAYSYLGKHEILHWSNLFTSVQFKLLADAIEKESNVQSNSSYR